MLCQNECIQKLGRSMALNEVDATTLRCVDVPKGLMLTSYLGFSWVYRKYGSISRVNYDMIDFKYILIRFSSQINCTKEKLWQIEMHW